MDQRGRIGAGGGRFEGDVLLCPSVLAAVLRGARVARVTAALAAAMDGFTGGVRIPFIGRRT